jgi:FkbM family methyltransferase
MRILSKIKKKSLYLKLRHLYKSKADKDILKCRISLYKKFCKEGDLVFDIGANIGNRVEIFLALKTKVVAVEPQSFCRKVLRARFGNKITLINKGLGEKEEIKTMYISTLSNQISSFSKEWIDSVKKDRFSTENWDRQEEMELTTLEKLITQFGIPSFVKIDVEGFEVNVLGGLITPVPSLSFEYTVPEEIGKVIACLDKLNHISPKYVYNYSIGESMVLELNEYYNSECFKTLIKSGAFLETSFGDIYAKISN